MPTTVFNNCAMPVVFPCYGDCMMSCGSGKEELCNEDMIRIYLEHLEANGKSPNTISKYKRDLMLFLDFAGNETELNIGLMNRFKNHLLKRSQNKRKPGKPISYSSINSQITTVNSMLNFFRRKDLSVKLFSFQKKTYLENQLSADQIDTLIKAAEEMGKHRLAMIILTIASSGIRVSELSAITVESLSSRGVQVVNKGKSRSVLLPIELKEILTKYCSDNKIVSGPIFITRKGNPVDRSNVWKEMKALAAKTSVPKEIVFPHNIRHYFARNYYVIEKDIAGLSTLLGHNSLNTTKIYVNESSEEAQKKVNHAGEAIFRAFYKYFL
ncbi:MAG: tyrosine-type recombinase/integrase [Clostridia bacterium]|nr:tyrosine-type recombinase/integrase [Clostridia bacterium]